MRWQRERLMNCVMMISAVRRYRTSTTGTEASEISLTRLRDDIPS